MNLRKVFLAMASVLFTSLSVGATAAELVDLNVLSSTNGVLDVLMVARPVTVGVFAPFAPTAWVFDVCYRPASGDRCPAQPANSLYRGTRLALQPGDTMKVHFINRLPPVLDSLQAQSSPGEGFLSLNPTNFHCHGLYVPPRAATAADPTWGDNIFVWTFNSANGAPDASLAAHASIQLDTTDYRIDVPKEHPVGVYWFHPHVHGISMNQIERGMSGMITIGNPRDVACLDSACARPATVPVRHLQLRDMQIMASGDVNDQVEPAFCMTPSGSTNSGTGYCAGSSGSGTDYTGGRWYFTLNGQVNPTLTVGSPAGEIWQMLNASPTATYDIDLADRVDGHEYVFQIISIDGVSLAQGGANSAAFLNRATLAPCPAALGQTTVAPVCATRLHMMPSARVEIWVTYRDGQQVPAVPAPARAAVLRTVGYTTGPAGDTWPAINLAQVNFVPGSSSIAPPVALTVRSETQGLYTAANPFPDLAGYNASVAKDPTCLPLAKGHHRRVYYGYPIDNPAGFGLGFEEIDQHGVPVPYTFQDIVGYDPTHNPSICLPLGPGNTVTHELWEIVNITPEDHNFHIHQLKFSRVTPDVVSGTTIPATLGGDTVLMDNIPLAPAVGTPINPNGCNTVADWKAGKCLASPVFVDIPFSIAGDYVYHCHILEHEDGGMMAKIRVRSAN